MRTLFPRRGLPIIIFAAVFLLGAGCSKIEEPVIMLSEIEGAGDINNNGVPNEIADVVMFTNYFMIGNLAFGVHPEASRLNSDANRNGIRMELADMVYMVRVLTGGANPYPMPMPETPVEMVLRRGLVTYDSPIDLGAVFLKFRIFTSDIGAPMIGTGAANMDLMYSISGTELRILIYNIGTEEISAGENTLVTIPHNGDISLIGAEAAIYSGWNVGVDIRNFILPYELPQNYPNPFSNTTTITLMLPVASDWRLVIWYSNGEVVKEYSGYSEAGVLRIVWDATDNKGNQVAPGIYFYTVFAGDFTATKTMLYMP